jgi:hypothetical protein
MSTVRTFKKGELLYKEGDKPVFLYLIQSGSVCLQLTRTKQTIELATVGGSQLIGEHVISGAPTNPHSAIAVVETKAVELPYDAVKALVDSSTQLQKLLTKGLSDKLKLIMRDFQSMKMERDNTPCPADQCAKIFGTVFHVARSKGEPIRDKSGAVSVNWGLMRQYAQRVFLESPKRLQMAVNVFVKLGWAKYEMVRPDDDPEGAYEIGTVHFFDLPAVEQFFEFFQYYHFKGGKQELLKTDERVMNMTKALIELGAAEKMDRHNAVRIDYAKVVEKFKASLGLQLNNDHWTLLENKGLLVKRQSTDTGVVLQFDFKEFERTEKIWRVLREVERWNEKGSVDPNEPVDAKKAQKTDPCCPQCGHDYEGAPKFCAECGHKFTAAA